ncbi:MAG: RNA repair transcriptional activator RtcR [Acidobacteriota bacterium]|nr:RNA repair transcriptional activator RtcR [Acidobacteriota bacterium]
MKKTVVIGLFGATLDTAKAAKRWDKWRPTLSLCRHEDLLIDRLDLLVQTRLANQTKRLAEDIALVSPETHIELQLIDFEDPWDFEEVFAALLKFADGYDFKPDEEDYLINITTGTHVIQICLFLLTESGYFPGRLIQASPPKKKDPGPGTYRIIDLDLSKYDQLAARFERETLEARAFLKSGIDTRNQGFNHLIEQIEQVAVGSPYPILLMGPTGAGKTQLASKVYELKKLRRQVEGAFVEVNCGTLRGDTAMSTLFGHVRGAFTGAQSDRPGLLRTAHNGLLFLDEIGELGMDEQTMLLRALEHKVFMPMGSDKTVRSDFQLIAGTNRDLYDQVRRGRFREDLLARINLWTFHLPGLAGRVEDIEPNIHFELARFGRDANRKVTFNKEAWQRYLAFATGPEGIWSANFRDLSASISRMATLAGGGRINQEIVEEEIGRLKRQWTRPDAAFAVLEEYLGAEGVEEVDLFDRAQLAQVIEVCRQSKNMAQAGRKLFQASRRQRKSVNDSDRLRKYLAKYNLSAATFWD